MVGKWLQALFVNSQGENRCSLRGRRCLNRRFVAVQIFLHFGSMPFRFLRIRFDVLGPGSMADELPNLNAI